MNPTVDNDLQKAIDDITNNTNQDPVFADPVAAPSSIPEGDTGELASPVGPFPAPEPFTAPAPAPAPEMPSGSVATEPAPMPEPIAAPEPIATPAPMPEPEMVMPPAETIAVSATETITSAPATDMKEVRNAVLRDLAPIVGKINMDPSKKFNLYKEIREDLHDDSVIAPAYETAREIADEAERADALLYIYDSLK